MNIIFSQDLNFDKIRNYETAIFLADSSRREYLKLGIDTTNLEETSVKLINIARLYSTALEYKNDDSQALGNFQWAQNEHVKVNLLIQYPKIINAADKAFNDNDFDKAFRLYTRALKFNPNDIHASEKLDDCKTKIKIVINEDNLDLIIGTWKFDDIYEKNKFDSKQLEFLLNVFGDMNLTFDKKGDYSSNIKNKQDSGQWKLSEYPNCLFLESKSGNENEIQILEIEKNKMVIKFTKGTLIMKK